MVSAWQQTHRPHNPTPGQTGLVSADVKSDWPKQAKTTAVIGTNRRRALALVKNIQLPSSTRVVGNPAAEPSLNFHPHSLLGTSHRAAPKALQLATHSGLGQAKQDLGYSSTCSFLFFLFVCGLPFSPCGSERRSTCSLCLPLLLLGFRSVALTRTFPFVRFLF